MSGRAGWVVAAAMVLAALLEIPFLRYITDDTFIHMQFARNLMEGRGFSFHPGEPTYGFTSPLWVMALAALGKLGLDLLVASKILGQLFTWLSIWAVWLVAREIVPTRLGQAAATLTWAVNAWSLRWAISGMETSMAVFFVVAGIAFYLRERRLGSLPSVSALFFGLAVLSRPECLGLLALAILDTILFRPKRRGSSLLSLFVWSGLILIPWALYTGASFGQFFPNTAYAKAGSFRFELDSLSRLLNRESRIIGSTNGGEVVLIGLAVLAVLLRARDSIGPWLRRYFLPAAWMVALPALYVVRGSVLVSRYLLPATALLVPFGFAAIDHLLGRFANTGAAGGAGDEGDAGGSGDRGWRRWVPIGAFGLFAVQNVLVLYVVALPPAISFTEGMENSLIHIGKWFRENTPPEASVAVPDIGAIGYYSDRRVIDLSGLVTPEMIAPQSGMTIDGFVESFGFAAVARPDYLVDRYTEPDRFGRSNLYPGVLEMLFHRKIGPLGIARSQEYYYTVYKLHWDRFPPPD